MCVCVFCCLREQARYKSKARDLLRSGCNELLRPDILTALFSTTMGSKVNSLSVVNHPQVWCLSTNQQTLAPEPELFKTLQTCINWHRVTLLLCAVCGWHFIISHAHPVETRLHPSKETPLFFFLNPYIPLFHFHPSHLFESFNMSLNTKLLTHWMQCHSCSSCCRTVPTSRCLLSSFVLYRWDLLKLLGSSLFCSLPFCYF